MRSLSVSQALRSNLGNFFRTTFQGTSREHVPTKFSVPPALTIMSSPISGIEAFVDDHFLITSIILVAILSTGRVLTSTIFKVRWSFSLPIPAY